VVFDVGGSVSRAFFGADQEVWFSHTSPRVVSWKSAADDELGPVRHRLLGSFLSFGGRDSGDDDCLRMSCAQLIDDRHFKVATAREPSLQGW
jgi:hypothetical protein